MGPNDWTRFCLNEPDASRLLNPGPLILDGESLDPGLLVRAARSLRPVVLSETAWKRISISRGIVDRKVAGGESAYGITTGTMGADRTFYLCDL
jgi:hypothetical protein